MKHASPTDRINAAEIQRLLTQLTDAPPLTPCSAITSSAPSQEGSLFGPSIPPQGVTAAPALHREAAGPIFPAEA
jgi:hypothetical protein